MGRLLRDLQTAAADRTRLVPHPRLYRAPAQPKAAKGDRIDALFRWGPFGWLMGAIWGPVLLVVTIVILALIG